LVCGQRGNFEGLPGLTGYFKYEGKVKDCGYKDCAIDKNGNSDYCYDPEYLAKAAAVRKFKPFDPKLVQVTYGGDYFCTSANKCDLGYGDCNYDSDCQEGLKCG